MNDISLVLLMSTLVILLFALEILKFALVRKDFLLVGFNLNLPAVKTGYRSEIGCI
jgi:hypothetical protein